MLPLVCCHAILQHGRNCKQIAGECACCKGLGTESVVVLQRSGDCACCKGLIVSVLDVEEHIDDDQVVAVSTQTCCP